MSAHETQLLSLMADLEEEVGIRVIQDNWINWTLEKPEPSHHDRSELYSENYTQIGFK